MELIFGYGKKEMLVNLPDERVLDILYANVPEEIPDSDEVIRKSLQSPIDSGRISEIVKPGETVCIITSDITRPLPSHIVLPPLLEELKSAGIKDEDITIVFGLGSHRAQTCDEMRKLVGAEVFDRIRCIDSIGEFLHIGESSTGTPYDIFEPVVNADRRICLGNIEFHYFAGYSGGAKAIMPGVSTRDAIQANHSKMVEEEAKAGEMKINPVRIDIDEVTNFIDIDFLINVVLDEKKRIRHCVSGHWKNAHLRGCELLDEMYLCNIKERADIVLVSQGGYPKDINLYQTQKALDNAKHAIKDGGIIILIGACEEGLGEEIFEKWMLEHEKPGQMIEHIQSDFQLGGHKAAAIAMVLEHARIFLVSDMKPDFVRSIHLEPFSDAQCAYAAAVEILGEKASVISMPFGGSTLPSVRKQ